MNVSVKIDGLDRLQASLRRVPKVVEAQSQNAVRAAAASAAQRARTFAPRDTGRLQSAIGHTVRGLTGGVVIGAQAPYWHFVEFGTVHMAARPFVRSARELEAPELRQRVRTIGTQVQRAWGTGGRF